MLLVFLNSFFQLPVADPFYRQKAQGPGDGVLGFRA